MTTEMLSKFPITLTTLMSIGSLTFFAGQQANKIDELFRKAHAAETERKEIKDIMYDIHGKVCAIEKDIHYLREKIA